MYSSAQIHTSLERAKSFLFQHRCADGLWVYPEDNFTLPTHLQTQFIKSAHACRALITLLPYLNSQEKAKLHRSLFSVLEYPLMSDSPLDYHALHLLLCAYSNTPKFDKIRKEEYEYILKKSNGGWQGASTTYHFTNYYILDAIQQNGLPMPSRFSDWAMQNLCKDGCGWGVKKSDDSQPSFTATILIGCILSGVSSNDKRVIHIIEWLESIQHKDGGWAASIVTDAKNSVYHSTAEAILAILLATGDVDRKSVQRGIHFLLEGQLKNGAWPHTTKDSTEYLFVVDYVVLTLGFFSFLINANSPQYVMVKNGLSLPNYAFFMYVERSFMLREQFLDESMHNLLFTRALGTTDDAQERRRDILQVLAKEGMLDDAGIIDMLKSQYSQRYLHLRKKDHLTLIKNDLEYLSSLRLVYKQGHKHFLVVLPTISKLYK